jgi:hypothetical protein
MIKKFKQYIKESISLDKYENSKINFYEYNKLIGEKWIQISDEEIEEIKKHIIFQY